MIEPWIADWRRLLIQNLNPIRKIVITGGSDAHGDMNYSCSRTLLDYECNDNAAGKVRTLVYAPGHNGNSVLSRLKKGNSIVTDGPVILSVWTRMVIIHSEKKMGILS